MVSMEPALCLHAQEELRLPENHVAVDAVEAQLINHAVNGRKSQATTAERTAVYQAP